MPVDPDMTLEPKLKQKRKSQASGPPLSAPLWWDLALHTEPEVLPLLRWVLCQKRLNIQTTFWVFLFSEAVLLQIDGAGRCHGAPVLRDDRQVTRPVVVRDEVIWFVVAVRVCGVVCDSTPDAVGEVV